MRYIFVGSTNPVKINAVITAAAETWPEVKVHGFEVESGVNAQPMSDDETYTGSVNRAKAVLQLGLDKFKDEPGFDPKQCLGVGLEGGVFEKKDKQLWSTVWATVIDSNGNIHSSNGARFKVPKLVATDILNGKEMGLVIGDLYNDPELKKKGGLIGAITRQFIDRTEEYSGIIKLALGLWYGQEWDKELSIV